MEKQASDSNIYSILIIGPLILAGLWVTSYYNYLLFHSLAELFSIVIVCGIFMVAWNTRRFVYSSYIMFLAVAYIFVGVFDLIHTLAYPGMNVFPDYNTNLPTQVWIAARYMEAVSLLLAPIFLDRKSRMSYVLVAYVAVSAPLLGSILTWRVFPNCYIEGVGLTPFKIGSEYVICAVLAISIIPLYRKRQRLDAGMLELLVASIVFTIASELAFTLYVDVYGVFNLIGHLFKIISFYLIYRAVIYSGLRKPYAVLFRDLTEREESIRHALEESRRRALETSALLECSRMILEKQDFKTAAESVFKSCKNLIGAKSGYVALLSDDGTENEVLFLDSGGLPCSVDPSLPMPIRGLRANAYQTGKTVYDNKFDTSRWKEFLPAGHVALRNVMFAPLLLEDRAVGLIGLANKNEDFTENDARLASAFADHAAIALQNSRSLKGLQNSEARYRDLSGNLEKKVKEKVAELQQAQRLAAIGQMVSVVAHEVRNPLQNIRFGVDLLGRKVEGVKSEGEIIKEIESGIDSLDEVVAELLNYARPLALEYGKSTVGAIIRHALNSTSDKLKNIDIQLSIEQEDKEIFVDTHRIERVLVNLFANAAEAMPEKEGRLSVNCYFENSESDGLVRLAVTDNGCGIDETDLRQIEEPFYTTKAQGTGLGIPICMRTVEAHGGTLNIKSKVNEGTTVEIVLPLEKPVKEGEASSIII